MSVGRGVGLVLAMSAVVVALAPAVSCGGGCRVIETRPLDYTCVGEPPRFTGELHFEREATFETFLRQQCLFSPLDSEVQVITGDVDWSREATFVAVGPADIDDRCITQREVDVVEVCDDGLQVSFADEVAAASDSCDAPRWTVSFVLSREDLRAALDAAE